MPSPSASPSPSPFPLLDVGRASHRVLVAVLAGLLVLLVAPPLARAQASVEVRIESRLDPASVTVTPGTTVTWVNADGERHRMRSQDGPGEFDSGNLERGERFSHTFHAEGTTTYVDDRERDDTAYHGTVVVTTGSPDPEPDPADPSGPETHAVSMADRRFSPATLEITTGDTVRFVNDDDREHTATADDRSFDSGILEAGQEFARTFTRAGTFTYLCLLHPDMTGTIAVADPGGTAPPPQTAPDPTPSPPPPASPSPQASDGDGPVPQRRTVQMRDFSFAPAAIQVPAGSTIVFENAGQALHTATAADGSFDSDLVSPGGSYERRFEQPGTFAYTCLLHPEMVGEVVVTAASGGGATAAVPPDAAGTPADGSGAAGDDTLSDGADPAPGTVVVSLDDFAFSPTETRIRVGDTIRFRNEGKALHTATARDGSYDSGLLRPGGVAEHTFETPGTFAYWCTLHPDMVATVRVAAADGTVPAADPTAALDGEATPGEDLPRTGGASSGQSAPATVSVIDDAFLPEVLEVSVDQEVVWTNDGAAVHTVTAEDGSFDSGLVAAGETVRMRFEEPGTVAYLCSVHPGMTAEVRVRALSDGAAVLDTGAAAALDGDDGGLSLLALELLMLGAFAIALAGFTALSRRVGAMDARVDT